MLKYQSRSTTEHHYYDYSKKRKPPEGDFSTIKRRRKKVLRTWFRLDCGVVNLNASRKIFSNSVPDIDLLMRHRLISSLLCTFVCKVELLNCDMRAKACILFMIYYNAKDSYPNCRIRNYDAHTRILFPCPGEMLSRTNESFLQDRKKSPRSLFVVSKVFRHFCRHEIIFCRFR